MKKHRDVAPKLQCEMGGKNPVVIMEDADMDLAVESNCARRIRVIRSTLHRHDRAVVV